MPPLHASVFKDIHNLLTDESQRLHQEDIDDDLEGEKETLAELTSDEITAERERTMRFSSQWRESVNDASKGVTERTDASYQRLGKHCITFLIKNHLIEKPEDFFCANPPADADMYIVAWIMNECDEIQLDGKPKPSNVSRSGYQHAQKMRASMTHIFGHDFELGSTPWVKDQKTGHVFRNPSVSEKVATYMVSLRNRKTRAGEVSTSARAITSNVMKQLYDFNHQPELWGTINEEGKFIPPPPLSKDHPNAWNGKGGARARRALQAMYTIAFICLLRSDEVLKINRTHITYLDDGSDGIILTLPFRKTHQGGGIKPFYLYPLPEEEAHLCPVRALSEWIVASEITSGNMFRKFSSNDRPSSDEFSNMTSEQFLDLFRNNLLDIEVDSLPYGTHSFRRGGCQYLASGRRWGLRRICEWGGWSVEFSNLTIVRYLISWNDNPSEGRESYFHPARQVVLACSQCGRSCPCGA